MKQRIAKGGNRGLGTGLWALGMLGACGVPSAVWAQPTVVNGSFESYTALPSAPGQWYFAHHWGAAGSMTGDPDYFHVQGGAGGDLPETPLAVVEPYSGQAILGWMVAGVQGSNRREYITGEFSEPLTPGVRYRLSWVMSNGTPTAFSPAGLGVSNFGVALTVGTPSQVGDSPLNLPTVFTRSAVSYSRPWEPISFAFTAESPVTHFTLGLFGTDAGAAFEIRDGNAPSMAYYFVDHFRLEVVPNALTEAQDGKGGAETEGGESVPPPAWFVPNAFTPNNDGENDRFSPVVNSVRLRKFEVFNRWGQPLYTTAEAEKSLGWDGLGPKGQPAEIGMYVWRMTVEWPDGRLEDHTGTVQLIR